MTFDEVFFLETKAVQEEIVNEFNSIENWEERYKKIINLGKSLSGLSEEDRIEDLIVNGCQSKVWLKATLSNEGKIHFDADSDAMIVKGLIALLLKVYSDRTPAEILETSPLFIERIGLNANLSQTRSNGLAAMVKQIKFYALAFQTKLS